MKLKNLFMLLLFAAVIPVMVFSAVPLDRLSRPGDILLDDSGLYVTQGAEIFVYTLKDFKFVTKFGKPGEGPEEFKTRPGDSVKLQLLKDKLLISSVGRISYFTKKGQFKSEVKVPAGINFKKMGNRFIGYTTARQGNEQVLKLVLADEGMKIVKDITSRPSSFQMGRRITFFPQTDTFAVYNGMVFFAQPDGMAVDVFDSEGNKTYTIKHQYKKLKVSQADIDRTHAWLKISPRFKRFYESYKQMFHFPSEFPPVRHFKVSGDKLYVMTYETKDDKTLFYIFDIKGKFEKKVYMPLFEDNPMRVYPYNVADGKLYQLAENEDTNKWELHITAF